MSSGARGLRHAGASSVDLDRLPQPLRLVTDLVAGILDVGRFPRVPDLGVDVLVAASISGRLLKTVRDRLVVSRHVVTSLP